VPIPAIRDLFGCSLLSDGHHVERHEVLLAARVAVHVFLFQDVVRAERPDAEHLRVELSACGCVGAQDRADGSAIGLEIQPFSAQNFLRVLNVDRRNMAE